MIMIKFSDPFYFIKFLDTLNGFEYMRIFYPLYFKPKKKLYEKSNLT